MCFLKHVEFKYVIKSIKPKQLNREISRCPSRYNPGWWDHSIVTAKCGNHVVPFRNLTQDTNNPFLSQEEGNGFGIIVLAMSATWTVTDKEGQCKTTKPRPLLFYVKFYNLCMLTQMAIKLLRLSRACWYTLISVLFWVLFWLWLLCCCRLCIMFLLFSTQL